MSRERLTITLRSEILKHLDSLIDGEKIRNRSHAIEYFLSKSLGEESLKVLILAGGKPVYFESENKSLPKAMVKIGDKPLLEKTLENLKTAKFTDVIISTGEGGQIIKEYFGDGSKIGLNISYLEQKQEMAGTAQPVLQAKNILGNSEFLLLYGDVLTDIDYNEFVEFHKTQKSSVCTMALTSTKTVDMWGLARMQGSRIVEFEEKPKNPKTFSRLINAGMYVLGSEIFSFINSDTRKLEREVFPRLAEEGKLSGYAYDGLWMDISSSGDYKQVMKDIPGVKLQV